MVAAVTAFHFFTELDLHSSQFEDMHWIPPVLYIFPIMYASLKFRTEGGLFTGLWCGVLTLPNVLLWHPHNLQWLVEATQEGVAVVVGLVLARLVEHEAAQRRVAEAMAERLGLLHREVTHAQEDERRRVARELHDETAQNLILLCRELDQAATAPRTPKVAIQRLEEVRAIAEETLSGVRRFIRDLRPSVLDDLGLVAAVEWLATDLMGRRQVAVDVRVTGAPERLPSDIELSLFRIVQEAMRNVEKHSEASQVVVDVRFDDGGIYIGVKDNGNGFVLPPSLNDLIASGRLGVVGMQERAQLLGGSLGIESTPGAGTAAAITLPSTAIRRET